MKKIILIIGTILTIPTITFAQVEGGFGVLSIPIIFALGSIYFIIGSNIIKYIITHIFKQTIVTFDPIKRKRLIVIGIILTLIPLLISTYSLINIRENGYIYESFILLSHRFS